MRVESLGPVALPAARALLAAALPHDRVDVVAAEKLFGDNAGRLAVTLGAFEGAALVGVAAAAGRYLKLLAVDERYRRRGLATRLLAAVAAPRLRVADQPGNYLSPGIDERYTAGRAFFAARGFIEVGKVENLRAPLPERSRTVETAGYALRRPTAADRPLLLDWIGRAFAPVWAHEVSRALAGPRAAVHAAYHGDEPVAFAAADGNNQGLGWFGPAGTDPAHRGRRLGEALLLRCLEDVRGLPEAGVIAWIGPKAFYAKTVGAVEDRRFLQLERT